MFSSIRVADALPKAPASTQIKQVKAPRIQVGIQEKIDPVKHQSLDLTPVLISKCTRCLDVQHLGLSRTDQTEELLVFFSTKITLKKKKEKRAPSVEL